ncbi:hypothetical protein [Streptomyces sp. NPDC001492]
MTSNALGGVPGIRNYDRPSTLQEYLPDATRPVERWYNRPNSGNVTTAMETILDICGRPPAAVIDPFSGAGCSAVAARRFGIPFFGIEQDPVLACVSFAKATARLRHVRRLRQNPEITTPRGLLDFCAGLVVDHSSAAEDRVTACLAALVSLTREAGTPTTLEDIEADLEELQKRDTPATLDARVLSGDCTDAQAWRGIPENQRNAVVFTSPPFYRAGIPLEVSDQLRTAASVLFPNRTPSSSGSGGSSYADRVVGMLRQLTRYVQHGWILMEHEPGDATPEGLHTVAERIGGETEFRPYEMLTTKAFSQAGPLSIIVCGRR